MRQEPPGRSGPRSAAGGVRRRRRPPPPRGRAPVAPRPPGRARGGPSRKRCGGSREMGAADVPRRPPALPPTGAGGSDPAGRSPSPDLNPPRLLYAPPRCRGPRASPASGSLLSLLQCPLAPHPARRGEGLLPAPRASRAPVGIAGERPAVLPRASPACGTGIPGGRRGASVAPTGRPHAALDARPLRRACALGEPARRPRGSGSSQAVSARPSAAGRPEETGPGAAPGPFPAPPALPGPQRFADSGTAGTAQVVPPPSMGLR